MSITLDLNSPVFDNLICPITQEYMDEPVRIDCKPGHSFDRKFIEKWFKTSKTCPVCRSPVTEFFANRDLQALSELRNLGRKPLASRVKSLNLEELTKF